MTNMELTKYWLESADEDFDTMEVLYQSGKYSWSLFIGHLVIEKLLKALYAKNNTDNPHAPKIHDLLKIAKKCELNLDDEKLEKLSIMNTFNIAGRYDDYKREFYNRCTKEYTSEQITNIKEVRQWLKEQLV